MLRECLVARLEEARYYERPAQDGVEAMLAFLHKTEKNDMAMIEVTLPRLNRMDLLRILRAMAPEVPVIIVAGRMAGFEVLQKCVFPMVPLRF